VTVAEWLTARAPEAPGVLMERLHALLAADLHASAERGADVFLAAAGASLARVLEERRFGRDGALDLLAVDALMTFAFEHAAERGTGVEGLEALTRRGVAAIAPLAAAHG